MSQLSNIPEQFSQEANLMKQWLQGYNIKNIENKIITILYDLQPEEYCEKPKVGLHDLNNLYQPTLFNWKLLDLEEKSNKHVIIHLDRCWNENISIMSWINYAFPNLCHLTVMGNDVPEMILEDIPKTLSKLDIISPSSKISLNNLKNSKLKYLYIRGNTLESQCQVNPELSYLIVNPQIGVNPYLTLSTSKVVCHYRSVEGRNFGLDFLHNGDDDGNVSDLYYFN